jgi:carbon monoxide dehydrogenase subunit G
MGIPIEKSFVVAAPAAAVWEFLTDPAKVASCLPGAAITGKEDDQTWGGTMTVKVGPVTASYRGRLRFERLDAAAREAEIAASGQETRGKGGADMRMKSRVVERGPGETEVTVVSDVNVVGVLAQFGRGMIQDVSDQLFLKFTDAMRRQLEARVAAEARVAPRVAGEGTAAGEARVAPRVAGEAAEARVAPRVAGEATVIGKATTTAAAETAASPATTPAAATAASPAITPPPRSTAPPPTSPSPPASEENVLDVGALGTAALGRAAVRTLRRPGFWIGVVALVLIVYWWVAR